MYRKGKNVVRRVLIYRGLAVAFSSNRCVIRTLGGIDFSLHGGRILNVVKRDKDKGSAVTGLVAKLCRPAKKGVFLNNQSVIHLGQRTRGRICAGIRVMFRSTINSFGPQEGVKRSVSSALYHLYKRGGRATNGRATLLLSRIKLPKSCTRGCPRRLSNNRYRHTTVTETVSIRPRVLVYSRTASTLSISTRTGVIRLLVRLHEVRGMDVLFVARSLPLIDGVDSHVLVVGRKRLIRRKDARRIVAQPGAICAEQLLSTMY